MKHTISYMKSTDDKVKIEYRPVHYYTLDEAECATVPPVARYRDARFAGIELDRGSLL